MEAVRRSIRKFEDKRYAVMKQRNIIGQVCHTPKSYDNVMHVGLRKVTFKWQRGNKIGMTALWRLLFGYGLCEAWAGCDVMVFVYDNRWGPVWEGVHLHQCRHWRANGHEGGMYFTGISYKITKRTHIWGWGNTFLFLLLKQIRFQPNDHKTIKETADELKIFEGIKHPNLVRYFGVELHRVREICLCQFRHHVALTEAARCKSPCSPPVGGDVHLHGVLWWGHSGGGVQTGAAGTCHQALQ